MREFFKRWAKAKGGAAAMIFAVGGVVMVMCVGAGVDLSRQAYLRARLSDAVDAAALGLVGKTSPEFTQASGMITDGPLTNAKQDAWSIFQATMTDQVDAVVNQNTDFVVTAQKTGSSVTASVTATAHIPTYFMGMVGTPSLSVTSHSSVENDLPIYQDFYLLLDNSPSMGVGATPTDQNNLMNATASYPQPNCAFACHDTTASENLDYYTLAKSKGITMRIDVVRQATQSLMTTATNTETMPNQFRVAIATFGANANAQGYTAIYPASPLSPPSANLTAAQTAASAVDLMAVPSDSYNNDRDTSLPTMLASANAYIPAAGDGSSATNTQKVLYLVSDGVNDYTTAGSVCPNGTTSDPTRCYAPIDTGICTTLKNRGIKIAVLYTTYLPLPTNAWYNTYISPFIANVSPQMQACASPGLFFEVSPTDGISEAMATLFRRAVEQARITG